MAKCKDHDFHYSPAVNEEGWNCPHCAFTPGEPAGFSPQLDRELIRIKVEALLMCLANDSFLEVSNSSEADSVAGIVSARCRRDMRFDQCSIVLFIFELLTPQHSEYWRRISDGVVAGHDPRRRCRCGALATSYTGQAAYCADCSGTADRPLFEATK